MKWSNSKKKKVVLKNNKRK